MSMGELYRAALEAGRGRVREDGTPWDLGGGEIELQARWFAGEFGDRWTCEDGRLAEVIDFGHWNREPGPDFTGATVRFGAGAPAKGDIEIDSDVRDWERHGHATNPEFDRAILHIFLRKPADRFFTRTSSHLEVAQVHLAPRQQRQPARSSAPAGRWLITDDAAAASLVALGAARHRLDQKGIALRRSAAVHGDDEAWFQALAVALGYKRNKIPFLLLAQRVPRAAAASERGEALLFGLAGFLEQSFDAIADAAAREYVRGLWDRWWDVRSSTGRLILAPDLWTLGAIRPANHPHRRVGALAALARSWKPVAAAIRQPDRDALAAALEGLEHPFWNARFTLGAALLDRPQALIGRQRITDILLNIFYPLAITASGGAWERFLGERGPKAERTIRTIAERYFGAAAGGAAFLARAAHQQGLLQIARDFEAAEDPEAYVAALRGLARAA